MKIVEIFDEEETSPENDSVEPVDKKYVASQGFESDSSAAENGRKVRNGQVDVAEEEMVELPPLPDLQPFPMMIAKTVTELEKPDTVVEFPDRYVVDYFTYLTFNVKLNAFLTTIPIASGPDDSDELESPEMSATEFLHDIFVGQMTKIIWESLKCYWSWWGPEAILDKVTTAVAETTEEVIERIRLKCLLAESVYGLYRLPEFQNLGNSFFEPNETIYEYIEKHLKP